MAFDPEYESKRLVSMIHTVVCGRSDIVQDIEKLDKERKGFIDQIDKLIRSMCDDILKVVGRAACDPDLSGGNPKLSKRIFDLFREQVVSKVRSELRGVDPRSDFSVDGVRRMFGRYIDRMFGTNAKLRNVGRDFPMRRFLYDFLLLLK